MHTESMSFSLRLFKCGKQTNAFVVWFSFQPVICFVHTVSTYNKKIHCKDHTMTCRSFQSGTTMSSHTFVKLYSKHQAKKKYILTTPCFGSSSLDNWHVLTEYHIKGCDSNFEVKCSNFKSRYK